MAVQAYSEDTQHVTDTDVLDTMGKNTEILNTIKMQKLEYLSDVMRSRERYELLQLVLQKRSVKKQYLMAEKFTYLVWNDNNKTVLHRLE